MIDRYGADGGMRTERENRSIPRKLVSLPHPDLGSNRGHGGEKLTSYRLSRGACKVEYVSPFNGAASLMPLCPQNLSHVPGWLNIMAPSNIPDDRTGDLSVLPSIYCTVCTRTHTLALPISKLRRMQHAPAKHR
jgi:hypothetical protein